MNLQALRKEWLMLHKNVKRVKTLQQIQAFRDAVLKWRLHYVSLISQIRPSIEERLRDERKRVDPGWAEHFREKQEPIWKFSFELSSVPDFKFLSQEMRYYLKSYKGYSDQEIEKKE